MSLTSVPGSNLLASACETLVIPVNCKGVAGCGLALQAKKLFPDWFLCYRECCRSGALTIGCPLLHWGMTPWFVSFPTKNDFQYPSRLEDIEQGLATMEPLIEKHGVRSIAFPKLGCGAGGLYWQQVQPLMEKYLRQITCDVFIYL